MKSTNGVIPYGWEKEKIASIGEVVSGATPKTSEPRYWDGSLVWITPKDLSRLNSAYIDTSERKITDTGFESCSATKIPVNSLIMSSRAPIGYLAINRVPAATNQGCKSIIPKANVSTEYLYYYLTQNIDDVKRLGSGSTFVEVGKSAVESVEVLIPPIVEQKKIADILLTVDEEIKKIDEIIASALKLKSGLMRKFFDNASGKTVDLSGVISIANGQVDPKQEPYKSMCLLAPNHIESGTGRILEKTTAESQRAISGKYFVEEGDVIYSKIRPYLMKVAIADENCLCSADMYPLKARDGMSNHFLFYLLLSERFTNFANSNSARTGIPKLNREELGRYSFNLPSKDEQVSIVSILSSIDGSISIKQTMKERLLLLRTGLMQDLLTGKVRTEKNEHAG